MYFFAGNAELEGQALRGRATRAGFVAQSRYYNKGVYMIAYSDNELLHGYAKNTKFNRETLSRLLEKSIGVPNNTLELENISEYYWNDAAG